MPGSTTSPAPAPEAFIKETLAQYTPRASTYDTSNGGWHADLAHDFTTWLPAPPAGAVLDLACGTGLVTLAYAQKVGPSGLIVGVDVTEAMLDHAKRKNLPKDSPKVEWVLGDITDLSSLDVVQKVLRERGGFDVISCCSALVLLPNPAKALKGWIKYLKPGGEIIVDVPTEDKTVQYLFNYPFRRALQKPMTYDYDWIEGMHSLEQIFQDAGLEVERSFRTKSYVPEKWYDAEQAEQAEQVYLDKIDKGQLLKTAIEELDRDAAERGKLSSKDIWKEIWQHILNEDGKLWDGHRLYVTIGRRRD